MPTSTFDDPDLIHQDSGNHRSSVHRLNTKAWVPMDFHSANRKAWNQLADSGSLFAKVATDQELQNPLKVLDGRGWLPKSVKGMKVLCLASGGGWQSILYAAAGAEVTVVDISESMLKLDQQEAERRSLKVTTMHASMDNLPDVASESFDIVHQPVSSCYIPDLVPMFGEIARVLKDDGVYISQHKQPTSAQISHRNEQQQFVIGVEYYHQGALPRTIDTAYRESGATEYLHRWEDLVGGLCRTNMVLEDLREPVRADLNAATNHFGYRGRFVPPYVRLKARRKCRTDADRTESSILWTP